jgi:predicted N-acetyltransferase YhbS
MTTLTTRPYVDGDAREYVRLAASAFAAARADARPTESAAFVAHIHSQANPAGRSYATLAEHEGQVVGHLSAIPFRFLRRDGEPLVCWQLGLFAVSAELQRGGIGAKLLRQQIAELQRERPQDCAYGYPNPRSLGLLLGWGLEPAAVVPAYLVPPRARRGALRDGAGAFEIDALDAAGAVRALEGVRCDAPARGRFVRDAAYFRWRFLGAEADRRYRFLVLGRRGGGDRTLLVLAEHRAFGLRFTVLVDGAPDLAQGRLGLALRAVQRALPRRPIYLTTNASLREGPPALRVPRRLDPRPVLPFALPGSERFRPELGQASYLTGDWMSF